MVGPGKPGRPPVEVARTMAQVRMYPPGRVCAGKGCKNVLSIYNPEDTCYVCQRRMPVARLPYNRGSKIKVGL